MNNDDMHRDETESLLKAAAPYLAASKAPPVQPPPHVVARLKRSRAAIFPEVQSLLPEDMKLVMLKLITRRGSMNGAQITSALRELRFALKDAGEGAYYALLHDLADTRLVEAAPDPTESQVRVYQITPAGLAQLQSPEAKSPAVAPCLQRIAVTTG